MNKTKEIVVPATATTRITQQRSSIPVIQNMLLVWLDTETEEEERADLPSAVAQLRQVVNDINTFTEDDQCIEFIDAIDYHKNKISLVIAGPYGERVISQLHYMYQVDSIFIFRNGITQGEQWTRFWPKIKGVFTEIALICVALKQVAQQCEYNAIPISFISANSIASKTNWDQFECLFLYTQILQDILSTVTYEKKRVEEFIERCCLQFADIKDELIDATVLEKNYHNRTPIWWYTCESFMYPMVNGALRLIDVDVTMRMGFFLNDLCRQIRKVHKETFTGQNTRTSFILYRGQGMSKEDFRSMTKKKGGLMAFNGFLSASKRSEAPLDIARRALINPDLIGVLFQMTVDPSQTTTPFASIKDIGYLQGEDDEILFSMHAVCRVLHITPMDESNRLFQVNLILTSNNDKDLRALTDRIRTESEHTKGWHRLAFILFKMGQIDRAQQVYETLLEQATKESDKGEIYYHLANAKHTLGEHREALKFYERALLIRQQFLPPNHSDLSKCYNNIGLLHDLLGGYSKALLYYEKALDIDKTLLPPNHLDLAATYNSIGTVYKTLGDYPKALSAHEKALEIQQHSLPPHHADLTKSYISHGMIYNHMGKYAEAITFYEKTLEIQQKLLHQDDPDLAITYNNIGNVYNNMGEYSKALSYYEKDLEISENILPPDHPDLAVSHNNIGNVHKNMGHYARALSSLEKALEIRQTLPSNHPDLASSYNNIGLVYENMRHYSKARSFYRRAFTIGQKSLPSNHPTLQTFKSNLNRVKNKV